MSMQMITNRIICKSNISIFYQ